MGKWTKKDNFCEKDDNISTMLDFCKYTGILFYKGFMPLIKNTFFESSLFYQMSASEIVCM